MDDEILSFCLDSLIRRAYLELALVYLTQTPSEFDSTSVASEQSLTETKSSSSISSKESRQKKTTKVDTTNDFILGTFSLLIS